MQTGAGRGLYLALKAITKWRSPIVREIDERMRFERNSVEKTHSAI